MAIIGQDSGSYTPQDVERKRQWAKILLQGQQPAREPFGALAQGLRGAMAGWNDYEAGKIEGDKRSALGAELKNGDWQGVMGSEWASPQMLAMASLMQGREWEVGDRQEQWAREDARAAAAASAAAAAAGQPDYGFTFAPDGTLIRTDETSGAFTPMGQFGKPEQPGFRSLTPEEKATAGLPPDVPAQVGPDGKIDVISGGGVNVDVNNMGSIPPGYKVDYDEAGNPVSMSPVPGSPAALEAAAAADKAALATDQTNKTGNIVVEDVDRAIGRIEKDPFLTTGFVGNALKGLGGSPASDVNSLISTIKANSAFDQLQAMRAASPTGGALGAVSDTEMGLLQSAIGNLEQSQSEDQLIYNLRRVQKLYSDIVNGPGSGETPPAGGQVDYKSKYGLE